MAVEQINAEINIEVVDEGLDIVGDASYAVEDVDACVVVRATFAVEVRVLSFTREEVLQKLYTNMALAARIAGPNSEVVDEFEADIEAVKAGGELAPYAWLFELE